MRTTLRLRRLLWAISSAACCSGLPVHSSHATTICWTDWTAATTLTATGAMCGVTVNFAGVISPAAQTAGGTDFWAVNSTIYTDPPIVDNPPDSTSPPGADIIRLTGGTAAGTQTIVFSQPVVDPVMAILSLGQPGLAVTYNFNAAFDLLNSGTGFFGGNAGGSLFEDPGNVLRGIEGHGIIQFPGTFTSISWTIPTAENWHGFQIGIPVVSVPEPATLALLGIGLAGLAISRRRKQ